MAFILFLIMLLIKQWNVPPDSMSTSDFAKFKKQLPTSLDST